MSFSNYKYPLIFLIVLILNYNRYYLYASNNSDITDKENKSIEHDSGFNFFLPQIRLQMESKFFLKNKYNYSAETNRIIDFDIIRYHSIVMSMHVNEMLNFRSHGRYSVSPEVIRYELDFADVKYETKYGIASLFFDHDCNNVFNQNGAQDRKLRWYGWGLRWKTYGMQTGDKNFNNKYYNNFFLRHINYELSVTRKILTEIFKYNYYVSGIFRYDILKYNNIIPYVEGYIKLLINDRTRADRNIETGIRLHSGNEAVTPYIGYGHRNDIDYYNGSKTDLYYLGLRIESKFGDKAATASEGNEMQLPDFRFKGSYGKFLNNKKLNFNTDIFLGLDFLGKYSISPFAGYRQINNSRAENAGLFPRYMHFNFETGMSFLIKKFNTFLEPHYRLLHFDEGNSRNAHIEKNHSAGFRVISRNMKTGFADKRSGYNINDIKWLNRINWSVAAYMTIFDKYYNSEWDMNLACRWDIIQLKRITPYIAGELELIKKGGIEKVYSIEPGIRLRTGLYCTLFYRLEHRTAAYPEDGIFSDFNLIGLRLEI